MLAAMTEEQFREWQDFHAIEPWGFSQDERRMGMLAAIVAAPHMPKGQRPPRPSDFMLDTRTDLERAQAQVQLAANMASIQKAQQQAAEIARDMACKPVEG